jgi:hypothetical protein
MHGTIKIIDAQQAKLRNSYKNTKIKCAFVGEKNFNIIKMHGTTMKMHNYFTKNRTPKCFDTIISSSECMQSIPRQVTQVFQMQLLVTQFKIKIFTYRSFATTVSQLKIYGFSGETFKGFEVL